MSTAPALPAWPIIDAIIDRALEEDLAGGDLTTDACVAPSIEAVGRFAARKALVVAGAPVAARVFSRLDPTMQAEQHVGEGSLAKAGEAVMTIRGSARAMLRGERVALNLVQRMCGIATQARAYVAAIPAGATTRVVDTRKTTPGLRVLERYAVRAGGAHNHRDSLGSAVLIKDNHLVAAGGVAAAIAACRAAAPHTSRITCEVDTLSQLDEALAAGADVILLDNMDDATTAEAMRRIRTKPGVLAEASGGITLARIAELARIGVDVISVGALTHSAPAADLGLDIELVGPRAATLPNG
jgi:nicotinate-nucleotide pyrophosphorylase (carboxylating)